MYIFSLRVPDGVTITEHSNLSLWPIFLIHNEVRIIVPCFALVGNNHTAIFRDWSTYTCNCAASALGAHEETKHDCGGHVPRKEEAIDGLVSCFPLLCIFYYPLTHVPRYVNTRLLDDVMEGINQLQATGITINGVHHRFALAWFSADLVARAGMLKLHSVQILICA